MGSIDRADDGLYCHLHPTSLCPTSVRYHMETRGKSTCFPKGLKRRGRVQSGLYHY